MAASSRSMAKVEVKLIHCVWRDGRPRFEPGPALRALGFKGEDLRHPDGRWFALQEASEWLDERLKEIEARRLAKAAGKPAKPARGPRAYAIEDLFEDLWRSQRFRDDGPQDGKAAPKTVRDYKNKAKAFGAFDPEFYIAPAARVTAPIVHGLHEKLWRAKGLHMANGMIAVLRLAYSHAIKRGKLTFNPCLQLGLPTPEARLRVATPAETEALLKAADDPLFDDAPIGDAICIALYTGQREADVLELEQRNEKDGKIRFIQNKTGARVVVPALPHLAARLEAIKERRGKIGHNSAAQFPQIVFNPRTIAPFKEDDFRHRFAALRERAAKLCPSLADFKFMDLRDTAVTRLAQAGCTIPEIAAITGHSLETIHTILKHYLELNEQLADAAIEKLAAWYEREGVKV